MQGWTIGRVLEWSMEYLHKKDSSSPRLEAQLLLAETLNRNKLYLFMNYDQPLDEGELADFKALLKRRAGGEPAAYILGRKSFWTLELKVGPGVLIPRPDTETLVEAALELLPKESVNQVLEPGVGSGAVALSLAVERPELKIMATDVSAEAIECARENAARLGMEDRLDLLQGDLFQPVLGRRFDMILMNPPYVSDDEYDNLAGEVRRFEPVRALKAGPEGLDVIRPLVRLAPGHLLPGGWLLFEIGAGQGPQATALLETGPFEDIAIKNDLAGRNRVALAKLSEPD